MTTLFQKAVELAKSLPEADQDALAHLMLEEMRADAEWERVLAKDPEKLQRYAEKAWAEHEAGKSLPLDPDQL